MAVKTFPNDVTEQGVFDMAGNVREWCRDFYRRYEGSAQAVLDPVVREPPTDESLPRMVVRGASFGTYSPETIGRESVSPTEEPADVGFRVVIECPEGPLDRR